MNGITTLIECEWSRMNKDQRSPFDKAAERDKERYKKECEELYWNDREEP